MFKEEKYLEKRFGKASHFEAPNGYFEGFSARMMERLKAEGKEVSTTPIVSISSNPSFWIRHRRTIGSVAAGVCVAIFSLGAYLHSGSEASKPTPAAQMQAVVPQQHSDTSIDDFVDYSMMDTDDMYAYMADAI